MSKLKPVSFDESCLDAFVKVVMKAHGESISISRGVAGVPKESMNKVKAAIASICVNYPERFDSLESQAAALACRIAKDHCYPDGNKRTAILTAIAFLETYGRPVSCSQLDFVRAGLAAANDDLDAVRKLLAD